METSNTGFPREVITGGGMGRGDKRGRLKPARRRSTKCAGFSLTLDVSVLFSQAVELDIHPERRGKFHDLLPAVGRRKFLREGFNEASQITTHHHRKNLIFTTSSQKPDSGYELPWLNCEETILKSGSCPNPASSITCGEPPTLSEAAGLLPASS